MKKHYIIILLIILVIVMLYKIYLHNLQINELNKTINNLNLNNSKLFNKINRLKSIYSKLPKIPENIYNEETSIEKSDNILFNVDNGLYSYNTCKESEANILINNLNEELNKNNTNELDIICKVNKNKSNEDIDNTIHTNDNLYVVSSIIALCILDDIEVRSNILTKDLDIVNQDLHTCNKPQILDIDSQSNEYSIVFQKNAHHTFNDDNLKFIQNNIDQQPIIHVYNEKKIDTDININQLNDNNLLELTNNLINIDISFIYDIEADIFKSLIEYDLL